MFKIISHLNCMTKAGAFTRGPNTFLPSSHWLSLLPPKLHDQSRHFHQRILTLFLLHPIDWVFCPKLKAPGLPEPLKFRQKFFNSFSSLFSSSPSASPLFPLLLPCPTFPLLLVILLPPENLFQQVNLLLLGVGLLLLLLILLLLIGVGLLLLCVDLSLLLLVSPFTFSEINQSKLTQLN